MSDRDFELEPVAAIAVATEGAPGQRQFFLQARSAGLTATLKCEKAHVQVLIVRIRQLLEAQGLSESTAPQIQYAAESPLLAAWTIGDLGLGYHEDKKMFVIVAREAAEPETAAAARFWLTPDQIRSLARQAESVVSSGRPTCSRCGLPIDPAGHPCPAANGSRPVF